MIINGFDGFCNRLDDGIRDADFFYAEAGFANEELRRLMIVVASDVRARDIFVGSIEPMHQVVILEKFENPINRHR